MKKMVIVTLICAISLCACSNKSSSSEPTTNSVSIQSTDSVEEKQSEESTDEPEITFKDLSEIPDGENLLKLTNEILTDIGTSTVDGFTDISIDEQDSSLNIKATVSIKDNILNVSAMKITFLEDDEWTILSVSEADSNPIKYYWICDVAKNESDIYDINTGEIISKKSETFNADEVMDDYKEEMDQITSDFDNALEDIADDNGVN